jgi:glutathione S-transferase
VALFCECCGGHSGRAVSFPHLNRRRAYDDPALGAAVAIRPQGAHRAGAARLDSDVKIEQADPTDPNDSIRRQNPLGKIPALLIEDGTAYYDSRVILDYLDHRAGGGKIIPRDDAARFAALRLQALCDGIVDASILTIYEGRWRSPDKHEPKWLEHQAGKVARGLAALDAQPPQLDAVPNVGQISLACALGYRDERIAGSWRGEYPRLVAWLDNFSARVPQFEATRPTPT